MAKTRTTHYMVLGVARDATHDEIQQAYYRKANELHPDRHAGAPAPTIEHANAAMAAVNEAWKVLRDPQGRIAYDASINKQERRAAKRRDSLDLGSGGAVAIYFLIFALLVPLITTLSDSSPKVVIIWLVALAIAIFAAASIYLVMRDMNR